MRFGSSEHASQSRQERFFDLLMSAARRGQHRRALPPATLNFAFVPALAYECRSRREHPPTGYPMSTSACISFFLDNRTRPRKHSGGCRRRRGRPSGYSRRHLGERRQRRFAAGSQPCVGMRSSWCPK
jgi:hypothetical protein